MFLFKVFYVYIMEGIILVFKGLGIDRPHHDVSPGVAFLWVLNSRRHRLAILPYFSRGL